MRLAHFARIACEVMGQRPKGARPAFLVRMIMGEMGEEFLLASRRVQPAKLLAAGYRSRFADLADALRHEKGCLNARPAAQAIEKSPAARA